MITGSIFAIAMLGIFDYLFARKTKARWFVVHAYANFFVVLFGAADVWTCLQDPFQAGKGDYNLIPFYFITGVHAYHMLAFSNLKVSDWVHHLLFSGVMCTFGMLDAWGPMQNLVGFFLSGLPGGIDYVLLTLVKHDVLHYLEEKKWNTRINVWLRCPGCLLGAFTLYAVSLDAPARTDFNHTTASPIMARIVAFLCAVNGLYYMQWVAVSTARKDDSYNC